MTNRSSENEEKGPSQQQPPRRSVPCNQLFSSLKVPKMRSQQQAHPQEQVTQGPNSKATNLGKEEKGSSSQQQACHQLPGLDRLRQLCACDKDNDKQNLYKSLQNKYRDILEDSDSKILDSPLYKSSPEKIIKQLNTGVYLKRRKQKFWVDKNEKNCFMIFANDLEWTPKDDPNCWDVYATQTSEHGLIHIAHLRNGRKPKAEGKINKKILSPETTYKVDFLVLVQYTSEGLDAPVNLELTIPNKEEPKPPETVKLAEKEKGEWIRIRVGDVPQTLESDDIMFSLYWNNDTVKKGLFIQGVIIEPNEEVSGPKV